MNSFIPKNQIRLVIIDGRVGEEDLEIFRQARIDVVKTIRCKEVYEGIAYHPDIVIHPVDRETLVVAPNVYDYYRESLEKYGLKLIRGASYLGQAYPDNIAYNVARIGDKALHNTKYTDPVLKRELARAGIELVDIKQGYSKCSLGLAGGDLGLTSDRGIYKCLKSLGFDLLLIDPGYIILEGQDYGFIGGSIGNISEDKLIISGSLDGHPDRERILEFLRLNNKEVVYLSQDSIRDLGTIMFF